MTQLVIIFLVGFLMGWLSPLPRLLRCLFPSQLDFMRRARDEEIASRRFDAETKRMIRELYEERTQ